MYPFDKKHIKSNSYKTIGRSLFFVALLLALQIFLSGCIFHNSDNVVVGDLCYGKPGCKGNAILQRNGVGRMRIDFSVKNSSQLVGSVTVELTVSNRENQTKGYEVLAVRNYQLKPGDVAGDRFTALEVGTRREVNLHIECDKCQLKLDYVVGIEPLQCRKTTECSSGWTCAETRGICVECVKNNECKPEQTCAPNGRCSPADRGFSCQAVPTGGNADGALLVLCVLCGVAVVRRKSVKLQREK